MKATIRLGRERTVGGANPLPGTLVIENDGSERVEFSRIDPYTVPPFVATLPVDLFPGNRGPLWLAPGEQVELPFSVAFIPPPPGVEREYLVGATLHLRGEPEPEPPPTKVKHRETGLEVVLPAPPHPPRFEDIAIEAEPARVTVVSPLQYKRTYY